MNHSKKESQEWHWDLNTLNFSTVLFSQFALISHDILVPYRSEGIELLRGGVSGSRWGFCILRVQCTEFSTPRQETLHCLLQCNSERNEWDTILVCGKCGGPHLSPELSKALVWCFCLSGSAKEKAVTLMYPLRGPGRRSVWTFRRAGPLRPCPGLS